MKLLVTICARAGSKGVKSKNIREFCGRPILYYTLASYQLFIEKYAAEFHDITLAVNTDSRELVEQMERSGIPYVSIAREEELAGDYVSKMSVIRDTLLKVEEQTKKCYDITVDLDLTSPIRTAEDIKGTIETLLSDENADISYSVTESRRSPYFNMVCIKENGYYNTVLKSEFVSRQQVPVCFDMNASIYAYRRRYLIEGQANERNAVIWRMSDTAVLDIDSEEDYELLGILMRHFAGKREEIRALVHKAEAIDCM